MEIKLFGTMKQLSRGICAFGCFESFLNLTELALLQRCLFRVNQALGLLVIVVIPVMAANCNVYDWEYREAQTAFPWLQTF